MTTSHLITITDLCTYYDVEHTFIASLQDAGLLHITVVNEKTYVPDDELQRLEKIIHLHHDLDINIAGIEAITHLLERMEQMQEDMRLMRNRLRMYED